MIKSSTSGKPAQDGNPPLLPAQQKAVHAVRMALDSKHVAMLTGHQGTGKTTILRSLHDTYGGAFLTSRDVIEASARNHPLALDETIYHLLSGALAEHETVIMDDFHFVALVSCCSHANPRLNFLAAALVPLVAMAEDAGKRLLFGGAATPMPFFEGRIPMLHIDRFSPDDFAAICSHYLGAARAQVLDVRKIHRFAPRLNVRQIRNTCEAVQDEAALTTDRFIDYLREHHMASNVDLGEVQAVDLHDLKGLDDVIESLEANVILPLENSELAERLELKSKRGVLLAGPPGTGKTTIGRALAHRLRSKFFLIDGTVITGTQDFYRRIHQVFEAAKQNAPGIIFIDDSDVIFESGRETGLYRYLLTMLDGLESTSAGRICLVMTAMDVGSLPPALVRSGRIELWLETRLPDERARAAILTDQCRNLPQQFGAVDVPRLANASEGLSGADLKRVVEDGKLLFAHDIAREKAVRPSTEYFLRAMGTVRRNKEQYAEAEARARMRHPVRPPYFDMHGMAASDMAAYRTFTFETEYP